MTEPTTELVHDILEANLGRVVFGRPSWRRCNAT
jgi:hypothetical protein